MHQEGACGKGLQLRKASWRKWEKDGDGDIAAKVAAQLFSSERCFNVDTGSVYGDGQGQVLSFILWA